MVDMAKLCHVMLESPPDMGGKDSHHRYFHHTKLVLLLFPVFSFVNFHWFCHGSAVKVWGERALTLMFQACFCAINRQRFQEMASGLLGLPSVGFVSRG